MDIEYRDGLLFTSIEISFHGKTKNINNIVIDTGASDTLISQDCVDDIGIMVTNEDEIVMSYGIGGKEHAFVKKVDSIKIEELQLNNISLDFSSFKYNEINGLLGLDILLKKGFIIDLDELTMYLHK